MDIEKEAIYETDVLVMGTDGLWDVTSNERVAESVQRSLEQFPLEDAARYRYRFTSAAQDLVMCSRGKLNERSWRTADGKSATIDDISVFVIPLAAYKEEYLRWKQEMESQHQRQEENVSPDMAVNELSSVQSVAVIEGNQPGRMTDELHTNGTPSVQDTATLLDPCLDVKENNKNDAVIAAEEDADIVAPSVDVTIDPLQQQQLPSAVVKSPTIDPEEEQEEEDNKNESSS